mmetsp:Transcript_25127/g.78386  ORF Transcript_25127/g.78386 Transcript_25127/m.78386 type:complete len:204 (+) Transcript_25127:306-917(+)
MAPSKRQQKMAQRQALARQEEAYAQQVAAQQEEEAEYAQPDPNTKITWPRHLAGTLDAGKLPVVWPNNINRLKTLDKGRRVAKEHGCDNPIVQEMAEVCQYLKLTHVMEPYKVIPRDAAAYPGRIRVKIWDDDGAPVVEDVTSRKALMRKMGELIPKLTVRKKRIEQENRQMAAYQARVEAAAETRAQKAGNSKKNNKKKGRK